MTRVYYCNIKTLLREEEYERAFRRSSSFRKKKAGALKNWTDQARCIGAGLLLRYALSDTAGICGKVLENADAGGRPYLTGEDGGTKDLPRISISHSGDYVAVAISDREVGVDIQKRRSVRESLTDRVMSPEEKREYDRLCSEDAGSDAAREYFLSVWTAKEAVSKMDGRGIFAMLPELSRDGWKEKAKAKILSRKIADDYMLAVAYH